MVNFRRDIYPFVGSYLNLDGVALHYLDEGAGEPVVMLHGNPTWSLYYRNLVAGLRHRCRTIVPDHVGCGFSDKPDSGHYEFTLDRRVLDLETLIDHLRLPGPITLVLHDWGGMIGMAYAARHPERIKRLIVLNTAAFHLPKTKRLPLSLWLCRRTPLGGLLVQQAGLFVRLTLRWGSVKGLPADVRAAYLEPCAEASQRLAHLRFVQDIPLAPGHPSFARVTEVQERLGAFQKTPTLLLWGEQDFVFDHHFLEEWLRRLPLAEVHRFPDAGHLILEDAGPAVLERIESFLDRHP